MREIKLKIDKKIDVRSLFRSFLMKNKVEEYYEKKYIESNKTIYVFAYETAYNKFIYGNKTPIRIVVSTTVIVTIYDNLTELSIVESSDNKDDYSNSLFLYFKDHGFYHV